MGATEKSLMSWVGKNADNPKPFGKVTSSQETITRDQLAEFEKDLLTMLDEMAEKKSRKDSDNNKELS